MDRTETQDAPDRASGAVREWAPGSGTLALWLALGAALSLGGVVVFGLVFGTTHGDLSFRLGGAAALRAVALVVALTAGLLGLHELVHGLTVRALGARPTFGAALLGKALPVLSCTAPGHRFSRAGYTAVALAPLVVLSAAGALLVALAPFGGWLVVPLGLHTGGAIGDLWVAALTALRPSGTLVEDTGSGVRFHAPAARARSRPAVRAGRRAARPAGS
jgi:hypothetical protein